MKKIISIIVIILISLGLGIFIGTKIKKTQAPVGINNTYQAGWDAAKARLAESPFGRVIPAGIEIKSISGVIQKIDGNKLTVKINPLEPLADSALDTRIIIMDSSTKISLNVQKDPAQFQKEMQDFQDKMKAQQAAVADPSQPREPIVPPMPFEQKEIKLSDLKEDQQISVIANNDIRNAKEFTAAVINAQDVK